jgi:plasmid stability protein
MQYKNEWMADRMANILIRNVDESVALRLNELAKKKSMSREAYIRDLFNSVSVSGELKELDFKYANLVELLSDQAKMLSDIIDRNTYVIEMVQERMRGNEQS